ncbi:hypothetical protein [Gordonia phthalatica]|uniref:Transmembrane protein n=1 Tax=Gordonia phthalatica TaxID=1136941 RepID=A0A0N9NKC4_9ACTN|nr:hypothetical protein [Gordonia phthalatica]ALG86148.1 hypothetical protein ACH46_18680 [Gordonia phthalatica]
MNQPYAPNGFPNATVAPAAESERSGFEGFSIAAIGVLLGAAVSIASYFLTWYYVTEDPDAKVDGLTRVTNSADYEVEFSGSRIHWLVLCAAVVLGGVAIWRLIGKYQANLVRPTLIISALSVAAGAAGVFLVNDGFSAGTGAYLALVGAVIMAASGAVMALAKK